MKYYIVATDFVPTLATTGPVPMHNYVTEFGW